MRQVPIKVRGYLQREEQEGSTLSLKIRRVLNAAAVPKMVLKHDCEKIHEAKSTI